MFLLILLILIYHILSVYKIVKSIILLKSLWLVAFSSLYLPAQEHRLAWRLGKM